MDDSDTARKRAQQWLETTGWKVTQQRELPVEIQWLLIAKSEQKHSIDIVQYAKERDVIVFQATVELTDEHRALIAGLPEREANAFAGDLRLKLLTMNVDFQNLTAPFDEPVSIIQTLAYDGMTKDTFMQRVAQVRRALLVFIGSIHGLMEEHGVAVPV